MSPPSSPSEQRDRRSPWRRPPYAEVVFLVLFGAGWIVWPLVSIPAGWGDGGDGWISQVRAILLGVLIIHFGIGVIAPPAVNMTQRRRMVMTVVTVFAVGTVLVALAAAAVWIGTASSPELRNPGQWLRQVVITAMVGVFGALGIWLQVPALLWGLSPRHKIDHVAWWVWRRQTGNRTR